MERASPARWWISAERAFPSPTARSLAGPDSTLPLKAVWGFTRFTGTIASAPQAAASFSRVTIIP